jgi:hypothetical protein
LDAGTMATAGAMRLSSQVRGGAGDGCQYEWRLWKQ